MNSTDANPVIVRHGRPLPPPRPGVRHVCVPVLSIVIIADDNLRGRIDRYFHWPMFALALLMVPLIAVELLAPPAEGTWPAWLWDSAMILIWFAFVVEFVVKVAVAESRLEYARHNWIDVFIIVVPVLRPLRAAYIARISKVFTLRGAGFKVVRYLLTAVLGFQFTGRLLERWGLRANGGRPDPRAMTRRQLMREVHRLRRLTVAWERWHARHRDHLEALGIDVDDENPPRLDGIPEPDPSELEPRSKPDPFAEREGPRVASRSPVAAREVPRMAPPCESPSPN